MRTAARVCGILAATAVALLLLLAASTFPRRSGAARVVGIRAAVTIEEDIHGVPTIRGGSGADVLFGLGYAHARDRLWQMEFQRRIGAGRLAEILGKRLVATDRFLRTIGFRRAAAEALARLDPEVRTLCDAYVAGINQYLSGKPALPIEFRLLRVSPRPFDAVDCLVWGKLVAWDLGGNAVNEIRRARLIAAVGPERAAELFPPVPLEPTILLDKEWLPRGAASRSSPVSRLPSRAPWAALESQFGLLDFLGFGGETLGSNSFVIAGARTKSGRPILGNDPHLGLRTPSIWYLARLEAPDYRAVGATFPGVPGIIIGHNARIAWGLTSLEPDVQDLYLEKVDPSDVGRYLYRGEWRRFETRVERIAVRGAPDVLLEVRSSVHGPIVTGVLDGADRFGAPVALRWTALDAEDRTSEGFFRINKAGDWKEFLEGASRIHAPGQNLVYADVDGHIGYTATGSIPIRPRADGLLPVAGTGEDDWTGYIPFERLPRVLDPGRGFVVTANNRVLSGRYPDAISRDWPEPYRARRITELILSRSPLDLAGASAIPLDRVSSQAIDLLPLLAGTIPADAASADALARLSGWNREFSPDSVPASIYAAWFTELSRMPQDEVKDFPAGSVRSRFLINALKTDSPWCDDVRTPRRETCEQFKTSTLTKAAAALRAKLGAEPSRWRWGRLHRARLPHGVFDNVALLRPFFSLETEAGGDASTVNVGAYRRDGSFVMTDGPSYRQVVDLADPAASLFVHTTGQSGNVFDRHYRDLLPLWKDGRYFRIGESVKDRLVLTPR